CECVRTRSRQAATDASVRDFHLRFTGADGLVEAARGDPGSHGSYWCVLATRMGGAGGTLRADAGQSTTYQSGAGTQERHEGLRMDCRPVAARATEGEFRASGPYP